MVRNVLSPKRVLAIGVAVLVIFAVAVGALALPRIQEQLGVFAHLLTGAMFLVGIGLGVLAAIKFKAHNDDERRTKLSTPIALAVVSAGLIGPPAWFRSNPIIEFGPPLSGSGGGLHARPLLAAHPALP